MTSILDKVRALGEENWAGHVSLHPMEREALGIFYRREGRIPTHGELETELARVFPPQFRPPPYREEKPTICPHCGQPWDDDDIPF